MGRFHRRGISGQDLSFDPGIVECMTSDPTARMLRLLSLLLSLLLSCRPGGNGPASTWPAGSG